MHDHNAVPPDDRASKTEALSPVSASCADQEVVARLIANAATADLAHRSVGSQGSSDNEQAMTAAASSTPLEMSHKGPGKTVTYPSGYTFALPPAHVRSMPVDAGLIARLLVDDAIARVVQRISPKQAPASSTWQEEHDGVQDGVDEIPAEALTRKPLVIEPLISKPVESLAPQQHSSPDNGFEASRSEAFSTPPNEDVAFEKPNFTSPESVASNDQVLAADVPNVLEAQAFQPQVSTDFAPEQSYQRPVPPVAKRLTAGRIWGWAKKGVRFGVFALAAWLVMMAAVILFYRFVDPPMSSLMYQQAYSGKGYRQQWRTLDKISPNLVRAVVVSEDWRFCQHKGIDFQEIEAAIARSRNGIPRGASTMTMQVAKNLFLWPAKSYIRKGLEVPLTLMIELFWSKRRIAEVYLNIVEWGPGVFGAEVAARHHFKKRASKLSRREAALLAVSLPNPIRRKAGRPGPGLRRMAGVIQGRMRRVGTAVSCILR